jgi:hypothetical protein
MAHWLFGPRRPEGAPEPSRVRDGVDGSIYDAILRERFPREEGETDAEWYLRRYGIAEAERYDPHDTGKVVRSANNAGQK